MSKFSAWRFAPLALLLLASISRGEEQALENWYQVELIVFAQQDSHGAEAYAENPELVYPSPLRMLGPPLRLDQLLPQGASYNEILAALMVPDKFLTRENVKKRESFVLLDREKRNLNPDAYALKRNSNYRLLFHEAWEQPINNTRSAQWVYVNGGDKYDNHHELEGSIRVYRSRFLHVNFNLWQSQFVPARAAQSDPLATNPAPSPELPPLPAHPPSRALQQLEMMDPLSLTARDVAIADMPTPESVADQFNVGALDILYGAEQVGEKTLTYIDHPRMGALLLITPIEFEEENSDNPE